MGSSQQCFRCMPDCATFAKIRMEPAQSTTVDAANQHRGYTAFRVTYYWRPRLQKMARQLLMIMNRHRFNEGTPISPRYAAFVAVSVTNLRLPQQCSRLLFFFFFSGNQAAVVNVVLIYLLTPSCGFYRSMVQTWCCRLHRLTWLNHGLRHSSVALMK